MKHKLSDSVAPPSKKPRLGGLDPRHDVGVEFRKPLLNPDAWGVGDDDDLSDQLLVNDNNSGNIDSTTEISIKYEDNENHSQANNEASRSFDSVHSQSSVTHKFGAMAQRYMVFLFYFILVIHPKKKKKENNSDKHMI
ncbi:hypothetical protein RFI_21074 [Reticulomyxa filosa]|uniref:Uncharacterized protein n=1 Tax=Reticulomyxa filosa TaxID=46433 RepID=X6MQJ4_RETFI|nr:hypothetical protein RFI_21074 [Reticulomyxa filosa]|eukprot:ETO16278.1 hypothetical protein RFI_21074 [Reticulomyxa filosa]